MRYVPILALALLAPAGHADEKDEALPRQRAAAAANWKSMEFKDARPPVETAHLIVHARLPEPKAKALAASLEKFFATAQKPLRYGGKDTPWPGKLAVYVLPDRGEFVEFMRKVVRESPDGDDAGHGAVDGDTAVVVAGAPRVGGADVEEEARLQISGLLLRRKLDGADPPPWLVAGFAQATASRVARPTVKAAKAPPVSFAELWGKNLNAEGKAKVATYLVDYLAYGPGAELFADFIAALRPSEGQAVPPLKDVAEAIKLDPYSLEVLARAWKKPPTSQPSKTPPVPPTKPKKP